MINENEKDHASILEKTSFFLNFRHYLRNMLKAESSRTDLLSGTLFLTGQSLTPRSLDNVAYCGRSLKFQEFQLSGMSKQFDLF